MATNPNGKQLLRASLDLMRADRSIAALPVIAMVTTLLAMVLIGGGGAAILAALGVPSGYVGGIGLFLALLAAAFIATYFGVAVVFAATERIEGGEPTIKGVMARAWTRRGIILGWAVFSALVGTFLNFLSDRGVGGAIAAVVGDAAWAVATWFAIPVIAFEDLGALATVKRSSQLMKQRFGKVARGSIRFGLLFLGWTLVGIAVIAIGVALAIAWKAAPLVGVAIAGVGLLFLMGLGVYMSVVQIYLRTIIYRFANGQSVPDMGIDLSTALS